MERETSSPEVSEIVVRLVNSDDELLDARRLHASCYIGAGYYDAGRLRLDGTVEDPWVPYSDYMIALDDDGGLLGTVRVIKPSPRGLQTFHYADLDDESQALFSTLDANTCVEISALATTRRGMQNRSVAAALYGAVWRYCVVNRHAYMIALTDRTMLRILRRFFGFPFEVIGPEVDEFGGPQVPLAMYVPSATELYRKYDPDFLLRHGIGLTFEDLDDYVIDLRSRVPEIQPEIA
ncbi:MAG: N-acyl amino acid synthase FeeM domain-containing protein [Acidimicrobiales bacterium]